MLKSMIRHGGRFAVAIAAAAVLAGVLMLGQLRARAGETALELRLARAGAWADSLEGALSTKPLDSVRADDGLAALYLLRHRLGLGSPFRLVDQALRDPLVNPADAARLGYAILERTIHAAGYEVDTLGLDLMNAERLAPRRGGGAVHLALVNAVVGAERDPRVGELTVRLAYLMASASGAASRRAPELAAATAAFARDRILASRDARALVDAAARSSGQDVFVLMRTWREERRFGVERPVIVPLAARGERQAVERVAAAVARLEVLTDSLAAMPAPETIVPTPPARRPTGDGLARRMTLVAEERDAPPNASVSAAVGGYARLVLQGDRDEPAWARAGRERFVWRARNEEALAAELALLRARQPDAATASSLVALTAGVALRPFAQEKAWLYGDDSPTARDLQSRFGIAVSYDSTVRAWWRPYLRRTLAVALADLRRVFPGYDPRGLRVRFGDTPLGDRALALHSPTTRTIYFPIWTSAGVMAHEFAHDIDWLAAHHLYGGSGWYRTDRAVRQRSDQLAGALRQMASASRIDTATGPATAQTRPTEVFARNVDWFVSAALAREGRVNGYLSAVQDPVLTGYASATTPEAAQEGGSATLSALDGMTTIPTPVRAWFSGLFGSARRVSVYEAVRQVMQAPLTASDYREISPLALWAPDVATTMLRNSPASSGAWLCLLGDLADRSTDAAATRAAMVYAAEARSRGLLRRWSEYAGRYPESSPVRLRALQGAPWEPAIAAETGRRLRDAILWRALSDQAHEIAGSLSVAARLQSLPRNCLDR